MAGYMDVLRGEPELAAVYPGAAQDRLFEATYRHVIDGMSCEGCGCGGKLVPRARLEQGDGQPAVHFGLIASDDTVMKSGEDRDAIAQQAGVIGFEMEGAGMCDVFPCVIIKGACDYGQPQDQGVAAVRGGDGGGMHEDFLGSLGAFDDRIPSSPRAAYRTLVWVDHYDIVRPNCTNSTGVLAPYDENTTFIGRKSILKQLQQQLLVSVSHSRVALFGLGGVGPEVSVFWVHASNAERFRQAYASIAQECRVPGYDDPKADVLLLVKAWLERTNCGQWLMVVDNADDMQLFFGQHMGPVNASSSSYEESLGQYLPECPQGAILVTTRNKPAGLRLTKGKRPIEVGKMDEGETDQLLRAHLDGISVSSSESSALSSRLEHLPLALVQAAAFIQENTIAVSKYLELLDSSDQDLVDLLSEEFETDGRDSEMPCAVAETWILSFEQIQRQNALAGELLSLMSLFDRQAIPLEFLSCYSKQQGQEQRGEIQLTKALGVLKAFCFVVEGKGHRFDMHRLVQLVTQKWLGRKDTICRFAEQALLAVSHCYPFGRYENWVVCSAYLAHAYAVLGGKGTGSRDEKAGKATLLHSVAVFLGYRGQWKDAERFQLKAVELRGEVLREEHPLTLASMGNLASTYQNQGRWKEAEALEVQVMETRKRVLGEEHPDTLTSMGNLASTYRNQGRWKEAEALEVQVMETRKRMLGEEHPDTLASMNNLAFTWKGIGRDGDALGLLQACFDLQQQVLGEAHPSTVSTLSALEAWLEENEQPVV
ncbi:hypothetical protein CHGG_04533 [Chaetomium globosum CBS 148.51]|uniref:NB-ARC domain-containing protein n=1 Tax=Chaetomium globosum (strain ATCC 6205 / CBS 148.51 / DSM 1962 / NBRC 6347 / NRRL 1970) TaxID=306901 RepID=Q2H113_CHAGB|nr:uncharacterized protein CHGG_04533 [Chaetomium globosum CBS 148.51]EAQ87914.1 hypothetical protein CHGG_04533 [Chaetomium globosum CBS 148.51]